MKSDETFERINRIWQEVSVIVFIHAAALALAFYAHLLSTGTVAHDASAITLAKVAAFREKLASVGLELPYVVGAAAVVYAVLFQRVSAVVAQFPLLRLSYEQTSLWRAGKCFDELSQLARQFEGYTASTALVDLEVTLELGITQYAKEFKEHHEQLVEARMAAAALWARYYSGFCLLAIAAIILDVAVGTAVVRSWVAPVGLLVAALIARCGWEAQIERAVLGRLRFAIDCALVNGSKRQEEAEAEQARAMRRGAAPTGAAMEDKQVLLTRNSKRLWLELSVAAELVQVPPLALPYKHWWLLHYVRRLWPFGDVGALPLISAHQFRAWLEMAMTDTLRRNLFPDRDLSAGGPGSSHDLSRELGTRYERLWNLIASPPQVPDDRIVVRLLRALAARFRERGTASRSASGPAEWVSPGEESWDEQVAWHEQFRKWRNRMARRSARRQ